MNANKTRRAGRITLALLTVAAVTAACTSTSTSPRKGNGPAAQGFGSIPPPVGQPKDGGTVAVALTPGQTPNYIYPNEPAAENGSVIAPSLLYPTLYHAATVDTKEFVDPDLSLAELPTYSSDRKTATIKLKPGYVWSDGRPVTSDDVIFSIDLIKASLKISPANWTFYSPGGFPDNLVSATAVDPHTVALQLTTAYNPGYFLNWVASMIVPLPSTAWNIAKTGGPHLDYSDPANAKAIYTYLDKQSRDQATFATNPLWQVVDGPFRLKSFDSTTGSFSLAPNTKYSGPNGPHLAEVKFLAFTSTSAVFNQLKAGSVDVATIDSSYLPQLDSLKRQGYNVYGAPASGEINGLFINFDNTTNNWKKVIAQPYVRQALQRLIDQQGYINSRGIYSGAAEENYSTAHTESPYAPSFGSNPPYRYDPDAAKKLLTDHGWKVVPGGTTTCVQPGTAANQCGAGIPQGQALSFNLVYANAPSTIASRDVAFISEAAKLGIKIDGQAKAINYMFENYDDNAAPAHKNEWAVQDAGPIFLPAYPAANIIFSTKAASNYGHYSSPRADTLLQASVSSPDPKALINETTFLGQDLPMLFLPNPDHVVVWKNTISGTKESFLDLTQGDNEPEFWYLHS